MSFLYAGFYQVPGVEKSAKLVCLEERVEQERIPKGRKGTRNDRKNEERKWRRGRTMDGKGKEDLMKDKT